MSALTNLNYIKRVFAHPCGTPNIEILVETAFPAAAVALLEVFMFGCRDLAKMRRGRTPWHSRGLSMLLRKKTLGVKVGPRTWVVEAYSLPVEAALNYFFFADVATGFIANWMSLVYQMSNCTLPGSGFVRCGVQSTAIFPNFEYTLQILCTETRPCVLVGGDRIRVPPGCSATITWHLEFSEFHPEVYGRGTVRAWLEESETGQRYSDSEAQPQPGGTQAAGGGVSVRTPAPGLAKEYRLKAISDGGVHFCNPGHVSVSAYGRKMEIIPTGCKPIDYDAPYPHAPVPSDHEARHARPGNFFGVGGTINPRR